MVRTVLSWNETSSSRCLLISENTVWFLLNQSKHKDKRKKENQISCSVSGKDNEYSLDWKECLAKKKFVCLCVCVCVCLQRSKEHPPEKMQSGLAGRPDFFYPSLMHARIAMTTIREASTLDFRKSSPLGVLRVGDHESGVNSSRNPIGQWGNNGNRYFTKLVSSI